MANVFEMGAFSVGFHAARHNDGIFKRTWAISDCCWMVGMLSQLKRCASFPSQFSHGTSRPSRFTTGLLVRDSEEEKKRKGNRSSRLTGEFPLYASCGSAVDPAIIFYSFICHGSFSQQSFEYLTFTASFSNSAAKSTIGTHSTHTTKGLPGGPLAWTVPPLTELSEVTDFK